MRQERFDQAVATYLRAVNEGQVPNRAMWLACYPDLVEALAAFLDDQDRFQQLAAPRPAPAVPEPAALTLPCRIGDYELQAEIGRGGMGVIYRARQLSLNRILALKIILAGQLATTADVQRFRREAKAAAHLDHPG